MTIMHWLNHMAQFRNELAPWELIWCPECGGRGTWVDGGNFLVVSMYGAKPDRHVTPFCAAPCSKELLQALANLEADGLGTSWLSLVDEPEALARLLLEAAPIADYECMDLGLLLAIQEARGMQMMTGPRAWSRQEEIALEDAVRHAVAPEGSVAHHSSRVDEVAWVFRYIRENWHFWGGSDYLVRLLGLKDSKEQLTETGIEEICSPPGIGDSF